MVRKGMGCLFAVGLLLGACSDDDGAGNNLSLNNNSPLPDGSLPTDGQAPLPDGAVGIDSTTALPPNCLLSCTSPVDCAQTGAVHDADNYACTGNRCQWLGCNDTPECVATYNSSDYACGTLPGMSFPACYRTCTIPGDCDLGNALHNADNYRCTSGLCEWLGCNNSTECTTTFSSPDWVCDQVAGAPIPGCYQTCTTPTDCAAASALYDADNYECNDNRCQWIGCLSTAECITALSNSDYVCE